MKRFEGEWLDKVELHSNKESIRDVQIGDWQPKKKKKKQKRK